MDENQIQVGIAQKMSKEQHGKDDITKAEFSSTMHICFHMLMRRVLGETFYSTDSMERRDKYITIRWMRTQLMKLIEDTEKVKVKISIKVYCIMEHTVAQWFATRTVRGLNNCPSKMRQISELLDLNSGFKGVYASNLRILMKDFISAEYDEEVLKNLDYMTKDIEAEVYEEYLFFMGEGEARVGRTRRSEPISTIVVGAVVGWIVSEVGSRLLKWAEEQYGEANETKSEKLDKMFTEWEKIIHINTICTHIYNTTPKFEYNEDPGNHARMCFACLDKALGTTHYNPKVVSVIEGKGVISVQSWASAKLALLALFKPLVKKTGEMEVVNLIAYKLRRADVKIWYGFLHPEHDKFMKELLEGKENSVQRGNVDKLLNAQDLQLYKELDQLLRSGLAFQGVYSYQRNANEHYH